MVRSKVVLIFSAFIFLAGIARADTNRYVVYFTDKANNSYSLDRPDEFLSQRALTRWNKHGITPSQEDLPVTMSYVEGVKNLGASVFFTSRWFNAALIQCDASLIPNVNGLSFVKSVHFIAPGSKLTTQTNDPAEATSDVEPDAGKLSTDTQLSMIGADNLHKDGFTGEDILIAVFDAGFPGVNTSVGFKHLYDNDRIRDAWDFVTNDRNVYKSNGHGTQVLSCIGGKVSNKFLGTAYDADFAFYITEDVVSETRIEEFNWLLAAERCDSLGVDVINSSVGYYSFDIDSMNYVYEDLDGDKPMITRAADIAASKGILVVTSAGNEGSGAWKHITAPADGDSVLAVGAVNSERTHLTFSSVGPSADQRIKPDVVAMGGGTTVINSNGQLVAKSGTSFASPLMAGFCASLMQANPEKTNMEIISLIKASGSNAISPDNRIGYGIPSYGLITNNAVINVQEEVDVYPNPFHGEELFIDFRKTKIKGEVSLTVLDSKGAIVGQQTIDKLKKNEVVKLAMNATGSGIYLLVINSARLSKEIKLIKF